MDINSTQKELRGLIERGNISDTIDKFRFFLNENSLENDLISETLLNLSAQFRTVKYDKIKNVISYETSQKEISKITSNLTELINDIPLLKFKQKETTLELIKKQEMGLIVLEKSQDERIEGTRMQLYDINLLINTFIEDISLKRKELENKEKNNKKLLDEIEELNFKIEQEKKKYDELKEQYESLKEEKNEINSLKKELEILKTQNEERGNHIKILSEIFVNYQQMLEEKKKIIEHLEKRLNQK